HTWYTATWCIDAFTYPNGAEQASIYLDAAPKVALYNNNVGAVHYSNMKLNGSAITIVAPNYYTVSFDQEGYDDQLIEEGLKAVEPSTEPIQEGCTFNGWYVGDEEFNFDTPITEDIELVANWVDERAIVTFADCNVPAQKVVKGQCATKPDDPVKQWNTFVGWYVGDEEFDFTTPIRNNITITARWVETEIITSNGVKLNKFVNVKGTSEVLNASDDNESLNYQGAWDSTFLVTDQFDTTATEWKLSAHFENERQGDANDVGNGFVIYFDADNYVKIYARWSNVGTIDGIHFLVHSYGQTSEVYQVARDQWGENFSTAGTFYDNWSDFGGWSTDSRQPIGDDQTGNWQHFRAESEALLNKGFNLSLYRERTTYKERLVDRFQIGVTDTGKDGKVHTWYSSSINIDAFTCPFGDEDSEFADAKPLVGFCNFSVGVVNISNIQFKTNLEHTVTFDVDGTKTNVQVKEGYPVAVPEDPTKAGYIFKGWKLNGENYDFSKGVMTDVTLVAAFEKIVEPPSSSSQPPSSSKTTSSSQTSSPKVSSSSVSSSQTSEGPETPTRKGCFGSVFGTSAIVSFLVIVGGVIIAKSKKKDD
ncbi:MAG TPA: InlB B-repeat-containing protein, partial [Erysipelotrichaceae bacterium]|nr:InlB B-repeat-containing protein [Erysipelotrichaceae bacterium]